MKYQIQLSNNLSYILEGADFNPKGITNQLNNPNIGFVSFGDVVVNKHIIKGIFPINEENK